MANERIGPYEVVGEIGRGGMGTVLEAVHVHLGRRVAIKRLTAHLAEDADAVRRFLREARTAASVRHPNVMHVIDVGTDRGRPYLVMELLEGETLAAYLARHSCSLSDVIDLFLPLCSALDAVHAAGVVHRDVKPDNVVLTRRGGRLVPKLVDFGIARLERMTASTTKKGEIVGTAHYIAPEQLRRAVDRAALDARADQFALGVMLYEALGGRRPFDGRTLLGVVHAILEGRYTPLDTLAPATPRPLVAVVHRLLASDPGARFGAMREVARALEPYASLSARADMRPFARPQPTASATRAPLVLVVAPAGPDRDALTERLLDEEAHVIVAADEERALEKLRGLAPDAILSAWRSAALEQSARRAGVPWVHAVGGDGGTAIEDLLVALAPTTAHAPTVRASGMRMA